MPAGAWPSWPRSRSPTLERVKPRKAQALADWGVTSVLDLLTTYPRRYIDRTRAADVADLAVGDEAVVFAEVKRVRGRSATPGAGPGSRCSSPTRPASSRSSSSTSPGARSS